jgi:hypothetical protein
METETGPDPLDGRWVLQVSGRIYGPYTGHALKEYAREGRVVPQSVVARTGQAAGEENWLAASEDPVLSTLFDNTQPITAQPVLNPSSAEKQVSYGPRKTQVDRRAKPTAFNIMIVADVKTRSSGPMENALMSLGPSFKLSANAWVVHTPSGAPEVVNLLTQHLGSSDRLFVVDATRNRTAWFNMGPETDAKIRQVWKQNS